MDDCCKVKSVARSSASTCPGCGAIGRSVSDATLRAMLPADIALGILVIERRFCRTQSCDVLYYGDDGRVVDKRAARVRVGVKEADESRPICYCFDVTRDALRNDVAANGESTLLPRIKAEVREGNCACETKNPSGGCCLGEVSAIVREEKRRLEQLRAEPANDASCVRGCCGE